MTKCYVVNYYYVLLNTLLRG